MRTASDTTVWRTALTLLTLVTLHLLTGCGAPESAINQAKPPILRVAHAGGGYNNMTYTNSADAVHHSLAAGFRLIELDFVWTADNQLVCQHDWHFAVNKLYQRSVETAPTLAEFKSWESPHGLGSMDLADLATIMAANPQMILITDIKDRNLDALTLIATAIDGFERRVIPQVYQPEEYEAARALGFQQVIWTLYRYQGDSEAVIELASAMQPFAITMNRKRVKSGLARELTARNIPVYAHTINKVAEASHLLENMGVTELYTDFLPAVDPAPLPAANAGP